MNDVTFSLTYSFDNDYLTKWTDDSNGCFPRIIGSRFVSYVGGTTAAVIDMGIHAGCLVGKPIHAIVILFAEIVTLGNYEGGETVALKTIIFHAGRVAFFAVAFFVNLIPIALIVPTWRRPIQKWIEGTPPPQNDPVSPLRSPKPTPNKHDYAKFLQFFENWERSPVKTEFHLVRSKWEQFSEYLKDPNTQIEGLNVSELKEKEAKMQEYQKKVSEEEVKANREQVEKDGADFLLKSLSAPPIVPQDDLMYTPAKVLTPVLNTPQKDPHSPVHVTPAPKVAVIAHAPITSIADFHKEWNQFSNSGQKKLFASTDSEEYERLKTTWNLLTSNIFTTSEIQLITSQINEAHKYIYFDASWRTFHQLHKEKLTSDLAQSEIKEFWMLEHIWSEIKSEIVELYYLEEVKKKLEEEKKAKEEEQRAKAEAERREKAAPTQIKEENQKAAESKPNPINTKALPTQNKEEEQKTKGSKPISVPKGKGVPALLSKEEEAKVKAEEIAAKERAKKLEISLLNHVQLKLDQEITAFKLRIPQPKEYEEFSKKWHQFIDYGKKKFFAVRDIDEFEKLQSTLNALLSKNCVPDPQKAAKEMSELQPFIYYVQDWQRFHKEHCAIEAGKFTPLQTAAYWKLENTWKKITATIQKIDKFQSQIEEEMTKYKLRVGSENDAEVNLPEEFHSDDEHEDFNADGEFGFNPLTMSTGKFKRFSDQYRSNAAALNQLREAETNKKMDTSKPPLGLSGIRIDSSASSLKTPSMTRSFTLPKRDADRKAALATIPSVATTYPDVSNVFHSLPLQPIAANGDNNNSLNHSLPKSNSAVVSAAAAVSTKTVVEQPKSVVAFEIV